MIREVGVLRWGGVFFAVMVAVTTLLLSGPTQTSPLHQAPLVLTGWLLAFSLFMFSYWLSSDLDRPRPIRLGWTLVMVSALLCLFLLVPGTTNQNLLLVLPACVLPSVLPWSSVVPGLVIQTAGLAATQWPSFGIGTTLFNALVWLVIQFTLALLIRFTTDERLARKHLAEANIQLHLTQALLEHTSREAERMRIARDLHDMLGHQLTVLGLELELMSLGLQPGRAVPAGLSMEAVQRAQLAQRRLMQDVRGAVDLLRVQQPGLRAFVEELRQSAPRLKLHFELPDVLPPEISVHETVLMRFFQESLTNTLRHARAHCLWLSIECSPDTVQVCARDDGRCRTSFQAGTGLTGLQERFQCAGGELLAEVVDGRLQLTGTLPRSGRLA